MRPAGCLGRRNEAECWCYSNELQRRQAPRGACPGGRSGLHLTGELRAREESAPSQYPAYRSKRSTALSRIKGADRAAAILILVAALLAELLGYNHLSFHLSKALLGSVLATLVGLSLAGLSLTNLAIVAGALSVGIGFGLQNIANNFAAGTRLLHRS